MRRNLVFHFIIVGFAMVSIFSFAEAPAFVDIGFQFDLHYKEWKTLLQKVGDMLSDTTGSHLEPFRKIVKLGPSGLPFIMEKVREDPILVCAVIDITKKYFPAGIWRRDMTYEEEAKLYLKWWYDDKDKTISEDFLRFYATYKSPEAIGKDKKKEALEGIKKLGIGVLPLLIERIEVGDNDLKEIAKGLTNNEFPAATGSMKLRDWWQLNKGKYSIPFPKD